MKTVRCVSLGCPKNLIDTEVMLGKLSRAGYRIIDEAKSNDIPDIWLINTCCFIKEAENESLDVIKQAVKSGGGSEVVVAGCLVQRNPELIRRKFGKGVRAVAGVFDRDNIVGICGGLGVNRAVSKPARLCREDTRRLRVTPGHFAYLRIAEGCNNRCSYCVIPSIHGAYRSKRPEIIIKEAKELVANGVRELNIIAQDTTSYKSGRTELPELLAMLNRISGLKWIRLLYTHPAHYSKRLIRAVAELPKVVKYLDLPVQHISDHILKRMCRRVSKEQVIDLISDLRSEIPGLYIRSTVIVGFPGETKDDFRELMDSLKQVRFERLGAFRYSREPGTPASRLSGQVPDKVSQARLDEVMRLQQSIAFEHNQKLIGRKIDVIIDSISDNGYIGRTYGDAPEVDGNIFIKTGKSLKAGSIIRAKVTGVKNYDLMGIV
ncbi:MAG: 30S ribosomal protein S12 methylthiotransferase RimO [Candidatus Brocadiia bacterium]